jgi:hypothetical protein
MTSLLDSVYSTEWPPLVIARGSLTARNEGMLLERYPQPLVARAVGPGPSPRRANHAVIKHL